MTNFCCFVCFFSSLNSRYIAKGRTNIELREQFILADGVSQTMTAFKSKISASSVSSGNRSAQSVPTAGPITKVLKMIFCLVFL